MSRPLALGLLVTLLCAGGCARWRHRELVTPPPLDLSQGKPAPTPPQPAQPLEPEPEYLKTAVAFLDAWRQGDTQAAYGLLSNRLRTLLTEKDFAAQLADLKLTAAQPVAHAGSGVVGYVVASITLAKPPSGAAIAGYSLLLKKEGANWRVALFLAEEKLASKYVNLLIIPSAKGKGYVVSYTDDKGNQNRSDLQEP